MYTLLAVFWKHPGPSQMTKHDFRWPSCHLLGICQENENTSVQINIQKDIITTPKGGTKASSFSVFRFPLKTHPLRDRQIWRSRGVTSRYGTFGRWGLMWDLLVTEGSLLWSEICAPMHVPHHCHPRREVGQSRLRLPYGICTWNCQNRKLKEPLIL